MSGFFKALSDKNRLKILEILTKKEHCVCELTEILRIPQNLTSYHLKILEKEGLLVSKRKGRLVLYKISPMALKKMEAVFKELKDLFAEGGLR